MTRKRFTINPVYLERDHNLCIVYNPAWKKRGFGRIFTGLEVMAVKVIREDPDCEIESAMPLEPGWIHARPGARGHIAHIDGDGAVTVMFWRTETATVVSPDEISLRSKLGWVAVKR